MRASLFAGFHNAVRSMQTATFAMSLHSSNISNANDPQYTKRTIATDTGATVRGSGVQRLRDAFVDQQYRTASGNLGESEVRRNVMNKVENVLGDPVDGGLRQAIDQLFDSWQGVAENPADPVPRLQLLTAGRTFAQQIKSTYQQLDELNATIDEELANRVNEVNVNLNKIFELNKKVAEMERGDVDSANLKDQRDAALDRLATLTGAISQPQADGTVRVLIGPTPVVDGPTVVKLELVDTGTAVVPTWNAYNSPTYAGKGAIAGLVSTRDGDITRLKQEIDNLGRTIAESVNTLHQSGTGIGGDTGLDFFLVGAGPADIILNPDLQPQQIAAGTGSGLPGDGDNARQISQLGESNLLESIIVPGQFQPPRSFYRNLIGWVGSRAQDAAQQQSIAEAHTRTAQQQRQSDFGVSLDEEVAQLSLEQKAFAAAARIISVMDSMLDVLINRTG